MFHDWKFENQTWIDKRNNFIYFISRNPYLFKSLINFDYVDNENSTNMFSTYIISNKSRSSIYQFMLERLRELAGWEELARLKKLEKLEELAKLKEVISREDVSRLKEIARREVLNYKYNDESAFFKIDILEKYNFWWNINKERDVDINHDFWKFILAKIWSSLYHYLIFHRWYIPSKLKSIIRKMMKYMKNYKHSKNIKIGRVSFYHKLKSKSMISTMFSLIALSSFPEISLLISYSDISNWIGTTFSKSMKLHSPSVQKVFIFSFSLFDYIDWENPSSKNQIKVMLTEYGVSYHTYVLYKFLENSWLLDSIKVIEFVDYLDIDFNTLKCLIVKYQSKHKMQWGISLILRANYGNLAGSTVKVHNYFYGMVSKFI